MDQPCAVGKDFNPQSCRFIKGCRSGYSRDKEFKCVKDSSGTLKKRSFTKEKVGLMKALFSNEELNDGLYNSPPLPVLKRKSKRLRKTGKKFNPSKIDNQGNQIPNLEPVLRLKSKKQIVKEMTQFIESIGPGIVKMNSPEIFAIAKSKGIELGNIRQKYLFRKSILDYISNLQPKKGKGKTKKVTFQSPTNVSAPAEVAKEVEAVETLDPAVVDAPEIVASSKAPSKKRSNLTAKATTKTSAKDRAKSTNSKSKTKKSKITEKSTKASAKPKSLTKRERERIMMEFVNKFGERIRHITKGELKGLARKEGIKLDTVSEKEMLKEIAIDFAESYETMNLKVALFTMGLNPDYSKDELMAKFKEKSAEILPDKSFAEKKFAPEIKRLNKVFDFLKERLGNDNFQHTSIEMPSDKSIINMNAVGLYNPQTVFLFYSKSSDKDPGKGAGEKINSEDVNRYVPLSKIKNWRKMLSNFWAEPFHLEGKQWQSVEHYYQASKFKGHPDFYNQFSLDSGSDISKDPNLAKSAGGKTGKSKSFTRPKEIKIDEDFFPNRSKIEMYKAQHAKFTQNDDLMRMLKLTGDAKLVHHVRGSPPIIFDNLMFIRSKL
jgi:ribA/ribD-fused uncharacterized protein